MKVELREVFLGDGCAPRVDVWVGGQFVGGMYQPEADRLVAEVVAHDHAEALECHECEEKLTKATP